MSKDVKDTEAQEELKDKVNAGDVKEEKETKEKHAKAKKEDKDQKIEELGQNTCVCRLNSITIVNVPLKKEWN